MRLTNERRFAADTFDADSQPELKWYTGLPDGDAAFFKGMTIGSTLWRKVTANHIQKFIKGKNDWTDDDFVLVEGVITQRLTRAQFTDGGGTSGTKDLNGTIPAGSIVTRSLCSRITGFTGDTSATLILGVTGGDTDRYMTGTPSVFTTAAQGVDLGVPSGTVWHTAAAIPTALITSAADFTNVVAGALTIKLFYVGMAL